MTEQEKNNIDGIGVLIELNSPDDFLLVAETLTRIGIASKKTKTLYQSCHILHKRGTYRIVHFLELFKLDGKISTIADEDYRRRNTILQMLVRWGLVKLVDQEAQLLTLPVSDVRIIPYKEKDEWLFVQKYKIGNRSLQKKESNNE